ncbi:Wzz/FepE/Etk N-terminal domain-containing protein [Luteibacter sp.]|uniref:Wzz/FepE/Etk N-terminal domain-containing protein n=1 Tax=Luteibacter sp. TaxID=1886636 RepID=UPI003F812512
MQQDEIYLIDMWRLLARQRWWFIGVFVAVLALVGGYLSLAKRQWEVDAWIQIGQIGAAPTGQDPKVESLLRVMERLKTDDFKNEVLSGVGIPLKSPEARVYRASMKLDPQPYANLLHVTIRAYSPEDARQLALATVQHLQAIHKTIGSVPLATAQKRLMEIDGELDAAIADRTRLRGEMGNSRGEGALASFSLAGTDAGIRDLQQARSEIRTRLEANYTFETSMPWPVHVSENPVAPMIPLVGGLGVLGGLFLGVLAAVAADALRRSTREPAAGTHWAGKRHGGERDEYEARHGSADAA